LLDATTNQALPVTIYQSKADADAVQSNGQFQQVVRQLGSTIIPSTIVRSGYEVMIDVVP